MGTGGETEAVVIGLEAFPSIHGTERGGARVAGRLLGGAQVVGDDDVAANTAGVNPRGGEVERDVPIADFLDRVVAEVEARS